MAEPISPFRLRDVLPEIDRDIRIVSLFWFLASAAGIAGLGVYSSAHPLPFFGSFALWSLAIAMGSATLGFLFGIPKVLQGGRPTALAVPTVSTAPRESSAPLPNSLAYAQRVNTNLEEISDWLTKIIVGVGLVELKRLPPFFDRLAVQIEGPQGAIHHSIALAIVAFYGSTGFLFGYLLTRLYLQGALARADQHGNGDKSFWTDSDAIRSDLESTAAPPTSTQSTDAPIDDELRTMAKEYAEINIENGRQRLARKNEMARAMYKHVVERGISRDALAEQTDEGCILALAALVHAGPQPGDVARLLRAGAKVTRLHVQYRITVAMAEIFRRGLASRPDKQPAGQMLRMYLPRADESLRKAIEATLNVIDAY